MQKYLKKKIRDERGVYIAVYAKDPEELERKVAERLVEVERRKALAANPMVWQYAQTWYKLYTAHLSDSRKSDYAIAINRHICPIIGARHMLEVSENDIAEVMRACGALSRSSQDKIVCALKKIFEAGERAGIVRHNPCAGLRAGGKKSAEKEALSRQQMQTLEDAVAGTRIYPFVMIGLYAGLRREEILGLQWDCVFLDEKTPYISVRRAWHVEGGKPVVNTLLKTPAAKRDVPIPKCLVACLKEEREKSESEYVISNSKGTVLTETQFVRVWKYITVRSTAERCYYTYVNGQSIKHRIKPRLGEHQPNNPKLVYTMDFKVTPHMLRHTYITNLIYKGVDPKTVQYLAGHENSKTTMDIYAKVKYNKPEELSSVVNAAFGLR